MTYSGPGPCIRCVTWREGSDDVMNCPRDPNKSGTGYSRGCRCDDCRRTNRRRILRRNQQYRDARVLVDGRLVTTFPVQHGKATTYGNYGCRCVPCTDANTLQCKKHRQRKVTS